MGCHAWNWRPPRRFLWWTLKGYHWCYNCPARLKEGEDS
jgi:hypothetical protein